jgi:hypothetical protein
MLIHRQAELHAENYYKYQSNDTEHVPPLSCGFKIYASQLFNHKRSVASALVLTLIPSQPRRKSSLPGGSAAKVFEPRSQIKSTLQKRGEFFAAHPAGSIFGVSGMSGVAFSWVTFFWRSKRK